MKKLKRITNFIVIISILVFPGCTVYGPLSGLGKSEYTTSDGTKITETTDIKTCEKTVTTELKSGETFKRTFPMEPEMCEKKETKETDK